MNPYTDARAQLVLAYAGAGLTVYGYAPPTLVPPVVTVTPGREWIVPNRVGVLDAKIELVVTAYVSLIDPTTATDALEELVSTVLHSTPSGVLIDSVDAPRIDSTSSQGDLLASDIQLIAQVKE